MLVLTRFPDEAIVIDHEIVVRVLRVDGQKVRIGIDADKSIPVHREEVQERINREGALRAKQGAKVGGAGAGGYYTEARHAERDQSAIVNDTPDQDGQNKNQKCPR